MKAFEAILPFLRPVEHLILDSDISEVMVNGNGLIFVEQRGCLREIEGVSIDEESLQIAVKNIARRLKDDISDERPLLNSRLPDGSRVAAVLSPVSIGGTSLTIRKFPTHVYGAEDLVGMGTMPRHMLEMLTCAIQDHKNILISGGTSSGKTTILNALASLIDPAERIVLIEDTSELRLNQRNLVRFEGPGRRSLRSVTGSQYRTFGDVGDHSREHRFSSDCPFCDLRIARRCGYSLPGRTEQHRRFDESPFADGPVETLAARDRAGRDRGLQPGGRHLSTENVVPAAAG
jgi:hypothetical protein